MRVPIIKQRLWFFCVLFFVALQVLRVFILSVFFKLFRPLRPFSRHYSRTGYLHPPALEPILHAFDESDEAGHKRRHLSHRTRSPLPASPPHVEGTAYTIDPGHSLPCSMSLSGDAQQFGRLSHTGKRTTSFGHVSAQHRPGAAGA